MIKRLSIILVASWILSGCVAGQHINLDHTTTQDQRNSSGLAVEVTVEDKRAFILDKNKDESYIGHYRAGFGNTWDVTTQNKTPLKKQIQLDLLDELKNLGFLSNNSGKKIIVRILEWNFDAYHNGKFWYKINIEVLNKKGKKIASSSLADKIVIKAAGLSGARGGFEKELPGHYDKIIDNIIRNNKTVLKALSST